MTQREVIPGEVFYADGSITINAGREVTTIMVVNTGDRPIQVGSHFHFAETNAALDFDRIAARGHHLAVAAGTSVRFEPGATNKIDLVPYRGTRYIAGFTGAIGGFIDE
jgi:urease subunit beta